MRKDPNQPKMTPQEARLSLVEMAYSVMLQILQPCTLGTTMPESKPDPHVGLNCRLPLLQHAIYRGPDGGFGAHFASKDPAIVKAAHDHMNRIRPDAMKAIAENGYKSLTIGGEARGR